MGNFLEKVAKAMETAGKTADSTKSGLELFGTIFDVAGKFYGAKDKKNNAIMSELRLNEMREDYAERQRKREERAERRRKNLSSNEEV